MLNLYACCVPNLFPDDVVPRVSRCVKNNFRLDATLDDDVVLRRLRTAIESDGAGSESDIDGDCSDCQSYTEQHESSDPCDDCPAELVPDAVLRSYDVTRDALAELALEQAVMEEDATCMAEPQPASPGRLLSVSTVEVTSPVSTQETVVPADIDSDAFDASGPRIDAQYVEGESWRKGSLLGTGAFSSCYTGLDVATGTIMAVKQVSYCNNTAREEQRMLQAITREIELMRGLRPHPHVIQYYGAVQAENHFNIFMEHMAGGCVHSLLEKFGALSEDVVRRYTSQVVGGLQHLHKSGVLHRDLKGANIVLDQSGRNAKLCDFGAASRMSSVATLPGEFKSTHGTPVCLMLLCVRDGC